MNFEFEFVTPKHSTDNDIVNYTLPLDKLVIDNKVFGYEIDKDLHISEFGIVRSTRKVLHDINDKRFKQLGC
jgi:hypothetical protein